MKNTHTLGRAVTLAAALGLPMLSAAQEPAAFDGRLGPGESAVVEGASVNLGASVLLAPGSRLVVRASEGIVFAPGADFSGGTLDAHVGPRGLAKPGSAAPVEALAASVQAAPGGLLLRYALPAPGRLDLRILDMQGRTVFSRSLRSRAAGRHEEVLGFASRRSGLYFVRAQFSGRAVTQRVFLESR